MKKPGKIISGLMLLSVLFSGCVTREASPTESGVMQTKAPQTPFVESTPIATAIITEIPATPKPTAKSVTTETPDPTPNPRIESTSSWLDLYEPVFENYRAVLNHGLNNPSFDAGKDTYGVLGSWDLTTWQDVTYGYSLRDLDSNGIPELIVGNMASADDNRIHALFTLFDNQPRMVLYSFTRSSYYLMNTGDLYYHGSGSAMWTDTIIYQYSGTDIAPLYGCFSSDGSEYGMYDYGFYLVSNGDRFTGNAEKVSQEQYGEYMRSLEESILPLDDLSLIWIY